MVLQQFWLNTHSLELRAATRAGEWRDIPIADAEKLYVIVETEHGDLPVPNALKEPEQVQGDFGQRIKELLGLEEPDANQKGGAER
jgi:hypothetical protein